MRKISTDKFIFVFLLLFVSVSYVQNGGPGKEINGRKIYRICAGEQDGKTIWIVDGLTVRREIFDQFLYGGNDERYTFIPPDEIWIDNAISAEEFKYTLAHELNERNLMANKGIGYDVAHDSSLSLERVMRMEDLKISLNHEKNLPRVSPSDCDGIKEISGLPDSITLHGIYRERIEILKGIEIWVVDGAAVRRSIYPDFGLSGNDLAYRFIPRNEIWIDGQVSVEETVFSINAEMAERNFLLKGIPYNDSYQKALDIITAERKKEDFLAGNHRPVSIPLTLTRDTGSGKDK